LAKNYVKDFGVCALSVEEEDYLLDVATIEEKNKFLLEKYKFS
jgi:hypothetical protein